MNVDVLSETFSVLKQYIPQKDRQEAADALMSVLVDLLNDVDIEELAASDSALKRALASYQIDEDDDDLNEFEE
jgi:cytochrome c553